MSFRRKILTIVIIVLLAIAVVLAVLTIINQKKINKEKVILPPVSDNQASPPDSLPNHPKALPQKNDSNNKTAVKQVSSQEKERSFLLKTARAFTERFGSYSSQANYENLRDLKVFATRKMQAWLESKIQAGINKPPSTIYYGITTRALNSQIINQTANKVSIKISTQRQEFVGSEINTKTTYQDILIIFEKEGGVWKVAGAFWQ